MFVKYLNSSLALIKACPKWTFAISRQQLTAIANWNKIIKDLNRNRIDRLMKSKCLKSLG